MAGIFPPRNQGGVQNSPNVCNGYTPHNNVIGEGPLYISPDCTTTLTDCQLNALVSEILAAVDALNFPFNANRIDNLGEALRAMFTQMDAKFASYVLRSGDWMTGPLHLAGDPTTGPEAANKAYVDARDAATAADVIANLTNVIDLTEAALRSLLDTKVSRSGDQMTGALILHADPTVQDQAATKNYVDMNVGRIIVAADVPTGAGVNQLWWDSSNGGLFLNYDDGTSRQWVQVNGWSPE